MIRSVNVPRFRITALYLVINNDIKLYNSWNLNNFFITKALKQHVLPIT